MGEFLLLVVGRNPLDAVFGDQWPGRRKPDNDLARVGFAGQTSGVNVDRWVSWTKLQSKASARTKVCVLSAHLLTNHGNYDRASANHRNAEMAQIMSELNSSRSHASTGSYFGMLRTRSV